MVCLGFEPGAAGWKAQTNPLSYGGTPTTTTKKLFVLQIRSYLKTWLNKVSSYQVVTEAFVAWPFLSPIEDEKWDLLIKLTALDGPSSKNNLSGLAHEEK